MTMTSKLDVEVYEEVRVRGSKSTRGEPSHSLYVETLTEGYTVATVWIVRVRTLMLDVVDHVVPSMAVMTQLR